jgi:hypothetical protein
MDLTNMKKADLMKQCKEQGIKNYSKLKKDDLIAALEESGIKNTYVEVPKKEKKETAKKATKPRLDKLTKKLEKFSTMETYKKEISLLKEDVADEDLLDIVTESMKNFIISDSISAVDYNKYVNSYGAIKALVEYMGSPDSVDISSFTEEKVYETLAHYIYYKDTEITGTLYKKIRKLIATNNKVKKPSKKVAKYVEEVSEEDDDDEDDEEEDDDAEALDDDDGLEESEDEDDE